MADADLDADVDRLREPIESYNDAVREAFDSFINRRRPETCSPSSTAPTAPVRRRGRAAD